MATKKEAFRKAFVASIPILCSYLFLGMAYGILMQEQGFGWLESLITSAVVYTGAFQFVLITFLSSGASLLTVAATALFMNSRQSFYALTFLDDFKHMDRRKLYMIHSLTDETYAVNWPIGCGKEFQGVYNRRGQHIDFFSGVSGKRRADREAKAAADNAVGAQHTHREVGNVHGAAAALAQAGLLAEDLSHHAVHIRALGHTVAVAAVSGLDHIVLPQSGAHTSGDGLLTDVQGHEAGNLTIQEVVLHALLKLADGAHGLIKVLRQFLGVFCCLCCCHRKNSLLPTLLSALFEICWDRCAGR